MDINIRAHRVNEIDTEGGVTLVLSGGTAIRIECPFDLTDSGVASTTIDPQNLSADLRLGSILSGRVVEVATADEGTGMLSVDFCGGLTLTVPPDANFEAWSTSWADGSMVVALPGGGLSSWDARQ